jgi:hypothetical protein
MAHTTDDSKKHSDAEDAEYEYEPESRTWSLWHWLMAAALGVLVGLWAGQWLPSRHAETSNVPAQTQAPVKTY